jgi:3-hydroxyacyl-[acyl-carrier-protein] dehydratase
MDITEIQSIIPHRYPMLLIDRVLDLEPLKRIVAIKNVTMNEQVFQGHFPGAPVFPGVWIIEAMAQAGAVLLFREVPDRESKLLYFTGIEEAKFRKPVRPGDQLRLEVTVLKYKMGFAKLRAEAYVDGQLVTEAIISSALADRPK